VTPGLDQQAACDPLNARFVQVDGSPASDNSGALHLRSDLSAAAPSLGVSSTLQNLDTHHWRSVAWVLFLAFLSLQ
jgi:hypothetical protein